MSSLSKTQSIWQNCITPLVIGCILFLIGVCCRQLSMLLMNEATLLLFVVFIVTSVILLSTIVWLIKNHHLNEPANADYEPTGISNIFTISPTIELSQDEAQSQTSDHDEVASGPPDYYSALANSKPVIVTNTSKCFYCTNDSMNHCYYCSSKKASKDTEELTMMVVGLKSFKMNDNDELLSTSYNKIVPKGQNSDCSKILVNIDQLCLPDYDEALERQAQIDRSKR